MKESERVESFAVIVNESTKFGFSVEIKKREFWI